MTTNEARFTQTDATALDHFRRVLESKVDYAVAEESEQLDRLEKMVQERRANLAAARYYPELNIAQAAGELVRRSEATLLLAEQLKQLDNAMAHDRR